MRSFTLDEGITMQQSHLLEWKRKLKSRCYNALENHCLDHNKILVDKLEMLGAHDDEQGYLVKRGNSLSEFVHNY